MDKPWFKFTANNWLSGSVQLLTDSEKGTYIVLIAMIWKEGGKLENSKILHRKLRLDNATACDRINSYCELDILHCEDGILSIKFLDSQLDDMAIKSKKAKENADKRWSKEAKSMPPHANKKREEEKREEKKRKEKTLEERKEEFKKLTKTTWLKLGGANYLAESEAHKFFWYWSEHGENDKKMRFEKQSSFGIGRRLVTWKSNNQKNSGEGRNNA